MNITAGKYTAAALSAVLAISSLTACGSSMESDTYYNNSSVACDDVAAEEAAENAGISYGETITADISEQNDEEYSYIEESGFLSVRTSPLSTFSADVDTASYTNIRRLITSDSDVPIDSVRIEEIINYFDYGYDDPNEDEPFGIYTELADCPWNEETQLFMVGINTESIDMEEREPMNLVFLIDVSGSMYSDDKLPLVQKSFSIPTVYPSSSDRISIVTYAGSDAVLLEGADGNDREKILEIINSLEAGGSTAGAAGITTAYEIAEKYFIEGGDNRIILATDGGLNVGISSESELIRLVEEKRENGVYLSVLGFGTGNYKDNRLEAIADYGNGNYSYIDCEREAERVLVKEMSGTLITVAKDVKFQVEFNPENVKGYRLIGYENRALADEDFADDTKDAGEVGAGHSVTVLYEIIPADSDMSFNEPDLKYSDSDTAELSNELLTLSIRYKMPDGDESRLLTYPVQADIYSPVMSEKLCFASAAAEFGMILRESSFIGDFGLQDIISQLSDYDYSDDEYKTEFIYLVKLLDLKKYTNQ